MMIWNVTPRRENNCEERKAEVERKRKRENSFLDRGDAISK